MGYSRRFLHSTDKVRLFFWSFFFNKSCINEKRAHKFYYNFEYKVVHDYIGAPIQKTKNLVV